MDFLLRKVGLLLEQNFISQVCRNTTGGGSRISGKRVYMYKGLEGGGVALLILFNFY